MSRRGSDKSAEAAMASPLSSVEMRNRLVRKPIGRGRDDDEDEVDRASARITRSAMRSPGERGNLFATSSPLDEASFDEHPTPGVSVIAAASAHVDPKAATSPSTPSSRGKRKHLRRSRLDSSQTATTSHDSDSDDPQPSGRLTVRKGSSPRPLTGRFAVSDDEGEDEQQRKGDGGGLWQIAAFVLVLLALVLAASLQGAIPSLDQVLLHGRHHLLFVKSNPVDTEAEYNATMTKIKEELAELRTSFPAQERQTWYVVAASIKAIFKEEPKQPSVLLLLSEDESSDTARCLGLKLSSLASELLKGNGGVVVERKWSDFSSRSALHDAADVDLSARGALLLTDLQRLPGSTAMALHAFADNLNAPHKRASVVLTVAGGDGGGGGSPEATAEAVLTDSWSRELNADQLSPLLSRLAVSVVKVNAEEKVPC